MHWDTGVSSTPLAIETLTFCLVLVAGGVIFLAGRGSLDDTLYEYDMSDE